MRLRTLFLVAVSLAALVGGLWYWRKSEETSARRLETWQHQARIDATAAALDKRFDWPLKTIPLVDFAVAVADTTGLAVDIDRLAIESEGKNLGSIWIDLPGGSLSAATVLRLGLEPQDLCYDVHDRRLSITTLDASRDRNRLRTVVYPLPQPEPSAVRVPEREWDELVTSLVEPENWDDVGGKGHCEVVPGGLLIVQSEHVHRRIRSLIEALGRLEGSPQSLAPVRVFPPRDAEVEGQVLALLRQPVTAHYDQQKLRDVLADVAQQHHLAIAANWSQLAEVGINSDEPTTAHADNQPLESLLRQIPLPHEAVFYIDDGAVVLASESSLVLSPEGMPTVAYPVHNLTKSPEGSQTDSLIELLTTSIVPDSWQDVGGPGSLSPDMDGWLIVRQTREIHDQIEQLLGQVRRALAYDDHPPVLGIAEPSQAELQIRAALEREIPFVLKDVTLPAAVADLAKSLAIPIVLDHARLADEGISLEERLTCDFPLHRAREQLHGLLGMLGLEYRIGPDSLLITTPDGANRLLPTRLYDVRTLTDPDLGVLDQEGLARLITRTLMHERWNDYGGPGSVQYFRGLAVVAHTDEMQEHVERFLALVERHCLPPPARDDEAPRIVQLDTDPATQRIEQLLDQPIKLELSGKTPYWGVKHVTDQAKIALHVENNCLPDTLVPTVPLASLASSELTLAGALERMLLPSGLAYAVQDGRLVVSETPDVDARVDTRLYRIDDLPPAAPSDQMAVIEHIVGQTDYRLWESGDGMGVIRPVGKRWLCISAASRLHERVADVLTEVRTGVVPPREAERRQLVTEMNAAEDLRRHQETEALFRSSDPPRAGAERPPGYDPFGP